MHLSFRGRYLSWMALPDRWMSWTPFALSTGLQLIAKNRPNVLFSTYPCATAHLIALIIHRITGISWIADFRDPMLYKNDNVKGLQYHFYSWIERQTMQYCRRAVFTTPGAIEHYAKKRYPQYPADKWVLIANGYDEQNFAECTAADKDNHSPAKLVLLHAGYLYRVERDPGCFFYALASLLKQNLIHPDRLKIVLRASGYEKEYGELIGRYGLQEMVFLQPAVAYKQALAEMLSADGLLLFQGALCNWQIPAKIYEYFRAKKPIFALTDVAGDTANLLYDAGIDTLAPLDDAERIASAFLAFYNLLARGQEPLPDDAFIEKQSRFSRPRELSASLERVLLER